MCKICVGIKQENITPEQAEDMLEEMYDLLKEEHIEVVEEKISLYHETYDYNTLNEMYEDELSPHEKQILKNHNEGYDFNEIEEILDEDDMDFLNDDYEEMDD
jgi:hypothetical protein